ncbi:MAG: hypothetical protein JOZ65_07070 [Chloroflexi bacterium]|nr:hypothetical protein [Chloroflexota bacterium]
MSSWITDIQTPDKYTVVLGTDQPRPSLFDYLQFVNISDPETYAGPNSSTKVVGTGPFEFVEWIQGDHVTLRKNAKYWRSGVPLLDEQQFMILRDPQAMVAQLEAGPLDATLGTPLRDAARLKDDPKYHYFANNAAGTYIVLVVNTTQPPLARKEVRQAINYALDRKRIVQPEGAQQAGLGLEHRSIALHTTSAQHDHRAQHVLPAEWPTNRLRQRPVHATGELNRGGNGSRQAERAVRTTE